MTLAVQVTEPGPLETPTRRAASRVVQAWEQRLRADEWSIARLHASPEQLLEIGSEHAMTPYANPDSGRFLADPFPFGERSIACEEFAYLDARGVLVAFDDHDGTLVKRRTIADNGRHLSYPFLFEHGGDTWCVPEQAATGGIGLYRFGGHSLHHERCLVADIAAFDTSIVHIDGRWWAFFSHRDGTAMGNRLDLWFADSLDGDWQPHPRSPFTGRGPTLRPAGSPLSVNGTWYRPAQDSRHTYGGRLVLNRIDELSPTTYHETPAVALEVVGDEQFAGPHTLSVSGDRVLIDVNRRRVRLDALAGRARRKMRNRRTS